MPALPSTLLPLRTLALRPPLRSLPRRPVLLLAAALLVAAAPAAAQAPGFTTGSWRTVETENFLFLYPESLSDWALHMAERMESVHDAVEGLVGYAPDERVTVLVDDPSNVSNGSFWPGPLLYMWPTPPSPRSLIGENRGWGDILAVHEFAHAAHLTRPTRNPRQRFLWDLLPIPLDPIIRKTPRWAVEGYATYVEGRLTGAGRPHGVWRPAILRTWALEGQLPSYGGLNGGAGYQGGAMAYLGGSAFLEWLVAREEGDEEAIPNVWRRLTAKQKRSFSGAFTGVFGAPPPELYGRFTVDVTERALAVRDAVERAGGAIEGDLFQRLSWSTGDPAVSPDGENLAIVLRSRTAPSRLVVISTSPDTASTKENEAYARVFAEDPEDVEPVDGYPRTQRPKATLRPETGAAYDSPAFMPDGEGILVVRGDVVGNGLARSDLFLWRWEDDDVRRITRGAAIREASPAPDGTWAAGVRCLGARCDIVRIDLADGAVTTIAEGDLLSPWYRPRVSPDGRTIVASVQRGATWRLVAMDVDGGNQRLLGPDDGAAHFDAAFLPSGRTLVLTSTRGGVHDLELLDLETGRTRPLTRMVSAAVAPAPMRGDTVFFLALHSRGWDLRRIGLDAAPAASAAVVSLDPVLSPAAPVPPVPADTFDVGPVGPEEPYGLGPRGHILLPLGLADQDGESGGLSLGSSDPIGRLGWQLQGLYGSGWTGGSLQVLWRGTRPWLRLEGFAADGPRHDGDFADRAYFGGAAMLELRPRDLGRSQLLRVGASSGRIGGDLDRHLGFGEYAIAFLRTPGSLRMTGSGRAHGAIGATGDLDWRRWLASGSLALRGREGGGLEVTGALGGTDAPVASFEAFRVGGAAPPLFDDAILSQHLAMPALPAGTLSGDMVRTVRGDIHGLVPGTLFYWAGSADGDGRGWYQLAGVELAMNVSELPYLTLPAARIRLGGARTFSDPGADEWRAWATLTYRP